MVLVLGAYSPDGYRLKGVALGLFQFEGGGRKSYPSTPL